MSSGLRATFCTIALALLGAAPSSATAVALTAERSIQIAPFEQEGTTTLRLTRESLPASADKASEHAPGTIRLSAGPIVEKVSKEALPGSLAFDPERIELAPGQSVQVQVTASGILFEGDAEADILGQGNKLGSVSITRAPLGVTVQGSTTLCEGKKRSFPYATMVAIRRLWAGCFRSVP
jgi:hypothetical protein